MYCPKCANSATLGQRFCRVCGTNLGVIVDAMDGKRVPLDFDSLKDDLRELGLNLRAGYEEAKQGFSQKVTSHLKKPDKPRIDPIPIRVKNVREGNSRRYSLQQGVLSIFSGSATAGVLYTLLHSASSSGVLANIERDIASKLDMTSVTGLSTLLSLLWLFPLIPAAKGVAHLINGIFFPVKAEPETREVVVQIPHKVSFRAINEPVPEVETNELEPARTPERTPEPLLSITEDETQRFGGAKSSI